MKAIIIAAGMCKRLRPLTNNLPKCLLKINGKTILDNMLDILKMNNISDISIIRGYAKEKINKVGMKYYENNNFENNNILHSLMYARKEIENTTEDVIISYSDIFYEGFVLEELLKSKESISVVVDTNWEDYYKGRTDHPIAEAENVIFDNKLNILKIGKKVFNESISKTNQGEFIGLWKFNPIGARIFLNHFDRLNSRLSLTDPFQNAKEWQKAYMTDIFQKMIDNGEKINCTIIKNGWKEFDTIQDFLRAGGELPK